VGVLVDGQASFLNKEAMRQLNDPVLNSPATAWIELPEFIFEAVVKRLQGDRPTSASFRHVCHAWREAHDRLVTALEPKQK
jgi:hypothetical protein